MERIPVSFRRMLRTRSIAVNRGSLRYIGNHNSDLWRLCIGHHMAVENAFVPGIFSSPYPYVRGIGTDPECIRIAGMARIRRDSIPGAWWALGMS